MEEGPCDTSEDPERRQQNQGRSYNKWTGGHKQTRGRRERRNVYGSVHKNVVLVVRTHVHNILGCVTLVSVLSEINITKPKSSLECYIMEWGL